MSRFGAPSILNPTIISSLLFMDKYCFLTEQNRSSNTFWHNLSVILMRNVSSSLCYLIFANSKDTLFSQRLSRLREADCKLGRFLLVPSQACHYLSKPKRVSFLVTKELLEIFHHTQEQPACCFPLTSLCLAWPSLGYRYKPKEDLQ